VANAVATLGTALGAEHMKVLRRQGASTVVLVLDGDSAGLRASERGVETAIEDLLERAVSPDERQGASLRCQVAVLEAGADPCDFIAERGSEAFREVLAGRKDVFDFKIDRVLDRTDRTSADARLAAARELMETAALARDPARRALYRQRIAERVGVPEETLAFPRPAQAAAKLRCDSRNAVHCSRVSMVDVPPETGDQGAVSGTAGEAGWCDRARGRGGKERADRRAAPTGREFPQAQTPDP
jgi:DNA primase